MKRIKIRTRGIQVLLVQLHGLRNRLGLIGLNRLRRQLMFVGLRFALIVVDVIRMNVG